MAWQKILTFDINLELADITSDNSSWARQWEDGTTLGAELDVTLETRHDDGGSGMETTADEDHCDVCVTHWPLGDLNENLDKFEAGFSD